jgi:hypothetical protein
MIGTTISSVSYVQLPLDSSIFISFYIHNKEEMNKESKKNTIARLLKKRICTVRKDTDNFRGRSRRNYLDLTKN